MRHLVKICMLICAGIISTTVLAQRNPEEPTYGTDRIQSYFYDKMSFRENKGQWDSDILYKLDLSSIQIYAERGQLTWAVHSVNDLKRKARYSHGGKVAGRSLIKDVKHVVHSHGFRMKFLNCNPDHGYYGRDSSLSYSNYFIGNDKDKWATHVRDYRSITYTSLYEGIDFTIKSHEGHLKYEFVIKVGAEPAQIKILYEGVDELNLVSGNLYIVTSVNEIKELQPYAYQIIKGEKIEVRCEYALDGKKLSYHLPEGYNKEYELVIDPTLVFASYSGSRADNWGMTATPGPNGEFYGGGVVFGPGYPAIGAYDQTYSSLNGSVDIGISKFYPDGSRTYYSTYIGGKYSDIPHSLIVNSQGDLVILGSTSSDNYPVTDDAYDKSYNGGGADIYFINGIGIRGSDIIISVLSEEGDILLGSTFMGGSDEDGVMSRTVDLVQNYGDQIRGEVMIDGQDNIYVASVTASQDFPIKSAFQNTFGGSRDGLIFSLNSDLSKLRWSSFLGGSSVDAAFAVKIDKNGNLIVGGGTMSRDWGFPADVIDNSYNGNIDGFIVKITADGKTLLNGTYIGTGKYDQVYFIQIDAYNDVYLYGQSDGKGIKVSPGVYGNEEGGLFIQKISDDFKEILFSTRIGTLNYVINLSPSAFLVDACGRIYISGWGGEVNHGFNRLSTTEGLPITQNAFQKTTDGSDFYFMVLQKDAVDLIYATYFGGDSDFNRGRGEHVDGGTSRFSKKGVIYQSVCAACGGVNVFPVTPDAAYTTLFSPNCNLGAIKLDFELSVLQAEASLKADTIGCAPFKVKFHNLSVGTNDYHWDFGDGSTSTEYEPFHTYTEPGSYEIQLIAITNNSCHISDTVYLEIQIYSPIQDSTSKIILCEDTLVVLVSRITDDNATYLWNTGATSQSIEVEKSGQYYVVAEFQNCVYRDTFDVIINTPTVRIKSEIVCNEGFLTLEIDKRAENISWSTGATSQSIEIHKSGVYIVNYSINTCEYSDTADVVFPALPDIGIVGDSLLCEGEELFLKVKNNSPTKLIEFKWNTGERGESIQVTETGEYIVTVISEVGCTDSDTIDVYFIPAQAPLNLPDSTILICTDKTYEIDLSDYELPGNVISWSDGVDKFKRVFTETGDYTVTIKNICQTLTDILHLKHSDLRSDFLPVYIPNAFTPNGDGTNDVFKPFFHSEATIHSMKLEVFDRWGNKIFISDSPDKGWKGMFKDKKFGPGVYMYTLDVKYSTCGLPHKRFLDGDVSLLK